MCSTLAIWFTKMAAASTTTLLQPTFLLYLYITSVSVKADFDFTVRFYEYWNPTGLCAECGTNGVPVCCDDPQRAENCINTERLRCDTRFRFIQRSFNAPLETAPNTTDEFPLGDGQTNENHDIFSTGAGGWFRMVNPVTRTNTSIWTGKIQFLVDAFDRINNNEAPNETEGIVDRFVINLDQLHLGADLTERTNYTGIYNISQLAMSFRVECSENYYGSNCTTFCKAEGMFNCDSNGNIVCNDGRDLSTNCTECVSGRDINTNCIECSENYYGSECTTLCEAVEEVYNCDSDGNIVCVEGRDSLKNCTHCLQGRDSTANCTKCLHGYIGDNCVMDPCLSGPCKNGATCTPDDTTGNYQCQCVEGYEGMNCESEVSENDTLNVLLIGVIIGVVVVLLLFTILVILGIIYYKARVHQLKKIKLSSNHSTQPHDDEQQISSEIDNSSDRIIVNAMYDTVDTSTGHSESKVAQEQIPTIYENDTNPHTTNDTLYTTPDATHTTNHDQSVGFTNPLYDEAQKPAKEDTQNENEVSQLHREYEVVENQHYPKHEIPKIRDGVFDDPEYSTTSVQSGRFEISGKSGEQNDTIHIENTKYELIEPKTPKQQVKDIFDDPEYATTDDAVTHSGGAYSKLHECVPNQMSVNTQESFLQSNSPPVPLASALYDSLESTLIPSQDDPNRPSQHQQHTNAQSREVQPAYDTLIHAKENQHDVPNLSQVHDYAEPHAHLTSAATVSTARTLPGNSITPKAFDHYDFGQ